MLYHNVQPSQKDKNTHEGSFLIYVSFHVACRYIEEISKIKNIILEKIYGKNIKRAVLYTGLNPDMFPSFRIALDKDDSENGSIIQYYLYYADETDFSDLKKKDIKNKKIALSVSFDDPGDMKDFDNIDNVVKYIEDHFEERVIQKYSEPR